MMTALHSPAMTAPAHHPHAAVFAGYHCCAALTGAAVVVATAVRRCCFALWAFAAAMCCMFAG
jgi:hypothetical protein